MQFFLHLIVTMKRCSKEKVLVGKKSQNDPPYPSRWQSGPGGKQDQGHGVVLHDQGEGNQPTILEVGVANYLKESMMCSKFRCEPQVPLGE